MRLFDSHCHWEDTRFDEDRAEAMRRACEGGVVRTVCVGSDLDTSRRCISLAEEHEFIYAAAGIHPHEAKDAPDTYLDALAEWMAHPRVCALGEIGLDYYYDLSPRDIQKKICEEQIDLACELHMPVIFHIRDAHGDMMELLQKRSRLPSGVIHCCSASAEMVQQYVRMGFYISFAGPVTFKNAQNVRKAAMAVPLDRLLIETDSPYMAPEPMRGRRNEPLYVQYVLLKHAEMRGISPDELAEITLRNANCLYGLPDILPA